MTAKTKKVIQQIAQKAVIFKNPNNILLSKYLESKYVEKKVKGKYCIPGGRIRPGEDIDHALIREIKEETGITIQPGPPIYVWSFFYNKKNQKVQIVAVVRLAKYIKGRALKKLIKEHEDKIILGPPEWVSLKNFNFSNMVYDEIPAVRAALKLKNKWGELL